MEKVGPRRLKPSIADVIAYAAVGMLFSIIDDAPFNVDHLFGPHYYIWIEVLLKVLTYFFFILSLGRVLGSPRHINWMMNLWIILAVAWANADDSLAFVLGKEYSSLRGDLWYQFDILIHVVSVIFLYLAVRGAMTSSHRIGCISST